MDFQQLGKKERELLLTALDIDLNNLKCQGCGEKVNYETCCIMPPIKTKLAATILCDSPLCISEYLEGLDEDDKTKKVIVKTYRGCVEKVIVDGVDTPFEVEDLEDEKNDQKETEPKRT